MPVEVWPRIKIAVDKNHQPKLQFASYAAPAAPIFYGFLTLLLFSESVAFFEASGLPDRMCLAAMTRSAL